jgi:hypothetical protein
MDPCLLSNSAENLRTSREDGSLYRLKEGFLSDMRSQRIKVAEKGRNMGKVTKSTSEDPLCRDVEVLVEDEILVRSRSMQAEPELMRPRLEFIVCSLRTGSYETALLMMSETKEMFPESERVSQLHQIMTKSQPCDDGLEKFTEELKGAILDRPIPIRRPEHGGLINCSESIADMVSDPEPPLKSFDN